MTPIHANEVDGAINAYRRQALTNRLQEFRKLGLGHLAGSHGEVFVGGLAKPRDVPRHRHVIGRIDKGQLGLPTIQER